MADEYYRALLDSSSVVIPAEHPRRPIGKCSSNLGLRAVVISWGSESVIPEYHHLRVTLATARNSHPLWRAAQKSPMFLRNISGIYLKYFPFSFNQK